MRVVNLFAVRHRERHKVRTACIASTALKQITQTKSKKKMRKRLFAAQKQHHNRDEKDDGKGWKRMKGF